jgi:hypothetical protein
MYSVQSIRANHLLTNYHSLGCYRQAGGCGIDKAVFESMIEKIPSFGLAVVRNLSRRIDHLTGKLGALS